MLELLSPLIVILSSIKYMKNVFSVVVNHCYFTVFSSVRTSDSVGWEDWRGMNYFLVNLSLRSHCTRKIFKQLKNLNGYVFHTEPFNIFALFTWNIEWHLNFGMVKVVLCEQNTLTREFSAGQKFCSVPCECSDRLVN